MGVGQNWHLFLLQKFRRNTCFLWRSVVVEESKIISSTLGVTLTVVPVKFFQYLLTIEFTGTCDTSTFWHSNLNCRPLCWKENGINYLLNIQCTPGITWYLGTFRCPTLISNFSLWFIKLNPGFITCTCNNISKLMFAKIWRNFQHFLSIYYSCPLLVFWQLIWYPACRNINEVGFFFRIKKLFGYWNASCFS